MCGPLKIWKWVIYVLSILFAAIGVSLTIVAVVSANERFIKAVEIDSMVKGYGIAFGVVIMAIGLFGWLSAKFECECLICVVILIITS
jgi:hypothetical protein